jgi:hypothetical protein
VLIDTPPLLSPSLQSLQSQSQSPPSSSLREQVDAAAAAVFEREAAVEAQALQQLLFLLRVCVRARGLFVMLFASSV